MLMRHFDPAETAARKTVNWLNQAHELIRDNGFSLNVCSATLEAALKCFSCFRVELCVGLFMALSCSVQASSVQQVSFDALCDRSELIIEGRVISSETRKDDSQAGFGTYITLEVLDRLKGPNVGAEFELRFGGGELNGRRLTYSDMRLPEVGEVGIYFVESLQERQMHPLVGWSQGHFVEIIDAQGIAGVYTPKLQPIVAVKAQDELEHSQQPKVLPGTGVALGIEIAEKSQAIGQQVLNVRDFKNRVRQGLVPQVDSQ